MTPPSRSGDAREERGRRRPVRKKGDPTLLVAGILLVVAVTAIAMAGFLNKKREAAAAAQEAGKTAPEAGPESPFGDIAPEEGPRRMSPGGKETDGGTAAPEGLTQQSPWREAVQRAEDVWTLISEGEAAEKGGDHVQYVEKVLAARDIADQLLFDTSEWVGGVQERYSRYDPQVREITREFERWTGVLRKYHGLSKGE